MLIILLLLAGFAGGMLGFYQGLMTTPTYNKTVTDFQTFNQTTRIYDKTYEVFSVMENATNNPPSTGIDYILGPASYLLNGAYNAGMLFLEIPNLFTAMIKDAVYLAGLPDWSMMIVMGIIYVMIIAGIIYFITGRHV